MAAALAKGMSMSNSELLKALAAPFAVDDHEFFNSLVYLSEEAVAARLDSVCPEWTWELVGDPVVRGGVIAQRGRLTISGIYRDGVGMAAAVMSKDGNREVNEPEKSAATDAFKRAARMFGVGRYLLRTPKTVNDYASLGRWLNGSAPKAQPAPAQQSQQRPQAQPAPQKQDVQPGDVVRGDLLEKWLNLNTANAQKPYKAFIGILYTAALSLIYDNNTHHMKNSIAKAEQSGVLTETMTVAQALIALATRTSESAA